MGRALKQEETYDTELYGYPGVTVWTSAPYSRKDHHSQEPKAMPSSLKDITVWSEGANVLFRALTPESDFVLRNLGAFNGVLVVDGLRADEVFEAIEEADLTTQTFW